MTPNYWSDTVEEPDGWYTKSVLDLTRKNFQKVIDRQELLVKIILRLVEQNGNDFSDLIEGDEE